MNPGHNNRAIPFYVVTAIFSMAVNLLMLVTPLYMLQIYDRVLTSGSMETLVLVSIAATGLLFAYGFAESARRKSMILLADFVQEKYGRSLFRVSFSHPLRAHELSKELTQLNTIQAFYRNGLTLPFFDLPFTPLFFLAMFLVHPLIGWLGVIGGTTLILITLLTEVLSRNKIRLAQTLEQESMALSQLLSRHNIAITSLGVGEQMFQRWAAHKAKASALSAKSSSFSSFFSAHAKGLRLMLQVGALGVGAWLVLQQQITAGAVVAGSILLGRALAPIDQLLSGWRQIVRHREAWKGIRKIHRDSLAKPAAFTPLPRPQASLVMQGVKIGLPGSDKPILPKFGLEVQGGKIILLLGQSGAGKTTFLQSLSGVWPLIDGSIHLGGRDIHAWPNADKGQYIGYAAQDSELLPGSIAENISRFSAVEPERIISATQKLGFHEFILKFCDGYDTAIGPQGVHLSRGQQQMISLARAFFGEPVLLCLDEPSSNLDPITFEFLKRTLRQVRHDGSICFISTHDTRMLELADQVLILSGGSINMVSGEDYRATLMRPRSNFPTARGGQG